MRFVIIAVGMAMGLFAGVWFFHSGSLMLNEGVSNFLGPCDATKSVCHSLPREFDGFFSVIFGTMSAAFAMSILQALLRKNMPTEE